MSAVAESTVVVEATPAPKPGIYSGIDFETYLAWDAVNQSRLNLFSRTPAHALYEIENGGKSSPAFDLGKLTHIAVFEPDRYSEHVVVPPVFNKRTKAGRAEWADFQDEHKDKLIAEPKDNEKALAMAKSVREHPTAGPFLTDDRGANEFSMVWEDKEFKVKCKARLDRYGFINEYPAIGDLKTSRSAARREFERSIWNFGYDVQAGHYLSGMESVVPIPNGAPQRRYVFVVVESEPPFLCAAYELEDEAIEAGLERRSRYLHKYRECLKTGRWPGYPDGLEDVSIPAWAQRQWVDH